MNYLISKDNNKVVTCIEAANARNIHLKQELKTILLNINHSFVAAHLRGCDRLNLKKIKKLFKTKNITFLSDAKLNEFHLKKGIVNPWNIDFCTYNILCKKVLQNRFMATNAGVFNKGVYFKPEKLLELDNLILKDIGEYNSEYSINC